MNTNSVSGARIRALMSSHRVTIREVAHCYDLTLKRVRQVRELGGPFDWPEIIAGTARIKAQGGGKVGRVAMVSA